MELVKKSTESLFTIQLTESELSSLVQAMGTATKGYELYLDLTAILQGGE